MLSVRRGISAAVVLVVAAFVVAGAGWWFFIREDNKLATNAPAIPKDLAAATASTQSPGSGQTFTIISDQSEAAYFAGEKLAALPLPSTAKGTTRDITGQFHLTRDGFDLDPSQPSVFTVNLKTLKSDKDMRDSRVHGMALETNTFPTATFTARSVTGFSKETPDGDEQTLTLNGTMDLHGVQKDIVWDVKARRQGAVITALATVNFKYSEFNITQLNIANFVSTEDNVTLQVQVVAQQT